MSSLRISKIEDTYYVHEKTKYYLYFPYEWLTTMSPGTGPNQCQKCVTHGIVDDAFLGYCVDCANYMYDMKRGHGFVLGKEQLDPNHKETSALFTYLKYTRYYFEATNIPAKKRKSSSTISCDSLIENDLSIHTISTDSISSQAELLRKLSVSSESDV